MKKEYIEEAKNLLLCSLIFLGTSLLVYPLSLYLKSNAHTDSYTNITNTQYKSITSTQYELFIIEIAPLAVLVIMIISLLGVCFSLSIIIMDNKKVKVMKK